MKTAIRKELRERNIHNGDILDHRAQVSLSRACAGDSPEKVSAFWAALHALTSGDYVKQGAPLTIADKLLDRPAARPRRAKSPAPVFFVAADNSIQIATAKNPAAVALGKIKSPARAMASKANGAAGGRPRSPYDSTFHRDGSVTAWDVSAQAWTRTSAPSDAILASLSSEERAKIIAHTVLVRNSRERRSMLAMTFRPSSTIPGRAANCPSRRMTLATALVAEAPDPIAIPRSACLSARASFTPSPVMATTWPLR